jgi:hypothetical protein
VRLKVASAAMLEREAKKIAAELVRPMNQGLISIVSGAGRRTLHRSWRRSVHRCM